MPGFSSLDDLLLETSTNGKFDVVNWARTVNTGATSAAGRWHECFASTGSGGIGSLSGTAGVGAAFTAASSGALPIGAANVTPDLRYLASLQAYTPAATLVPGRILLVDLLYQYPSCVVTGTPTTLNNTAPRPTRLGTGAGVRVGAAVNGALGAATPLLTLSYTNQAGTSGRSGTLQASAASLPVGTLLSPGATAGIQGGPAMNLAAGDSGVRQIDSYAITSGGTTGTVTLFLYRPIASLPLVAANTEALTNLLNDLPPLSQIQDDACLTFLALTGGALVANQQIAGDLKTVWG